MFFWIKRVVWASKYAKLTVKHKWFVLLAGRKLGVSYWRLLKHDLSKFGVKEIFAYGRQFFGDRSDSAGFARAWLHHQNHNDHHWEYWIARSGHNRLSGRGTVPEEMSEGAMLEMMADWLGAGRAYEGSWPNVHNWLWLNNHFSKMHLNMTTRGKIENILREMKRVPKGLLSK